MVMTHKSEQKRIFVEVSDNVGLSGSLDSYNLGTVKIDQKQCTICLWSQIKITIFKTKPYKIFKGKHFKS